MAETKHWSRALYRVHACLTARRWAKTQPSLKVAWRRCPHGAWLIWIMHIANMTARPPFNRLIWNASSDQEMRRLIWKHYPTVPAKVVRVLEKAVR